jgi:hypothetical protein
MQRFAARRVAVPLAAVQSRQHHFPLGPPPIEIEYLDSDPLDFALRTECREFNFDDVNYMRELAFIRIHDNQHLTVGDFRAMTPDQRKKMFWGSQRQDFFRWFVWKLTEKKEHLYHQGWDNVD